MSNSKQIKFQSPKSDPTRPVPRSSLAYISSGQTVFFFRIDSFLYRKISIENSFIEKKQKFSFQIVRQYNYNSYYQRSFCSAFLYYLIALNNQKSIFVLIVIREIFLFRKKSLIRKKYKYLVSILNKICLIFFIIKFFFYKKYFCTIKHFFYQIAILILLLKFINKIIKFI